MKDWTVSSMFRFIHNVKSSQRELWNFKIEVGPKVEKAADDDEIIEMWLNKNLQASYRKNRLYYFILTLKDVFNTPSHVLWQ